MRAGAMKGPIKKLLRWDEKTALEKSIARYRLLYVVASLICWFPIPIWHLLYRFGSDKHRPGFHCFGRTYQELLRPLKYRRIRLLEIGIGGTLDEVGGRSLLAWRAFFPLGTIVGFDLQDKGRLATRRIKIYRGDQGSAADLTRLRTEEGPFDIIVDDGSHLSRHQLATFRHLFGALPQGGLYVIEDVQTSYWPENVGGVVWDGAHPDDADFRGTCMGHFLELSKYLNHAEFLHPPGPDSPFAALMTEVRRVVFEHNMIIIIKGRNEDPSTRRWLDGG